MNYQVIGGFFEVACEHFYDSRKSVANVSREQLHFTHDLGQRRNRRHLQPEH